MKGSESKLVISQQPQFVANITYHISTTNQSFLDMHYYLKERGIKNNAFFLAIFDTDLIGVDPRDPRLPFEMKKKVLAECYRNFWYFIREVVRIPVQGGAIGNGIPYKLTRGNLALNWACINNINFFLELPRQHGKTISEIKRLTQHIWKQVCSLWLIARKEVKSFSHYNVI